MFLVHAMSEIVLKTSDIPEVIEGEYTAFIDRDEIN